MTENEDWFPPPVRVFGRYDDSHTQVGTASNLLETDHVNFMIRATQAEVDHLAACHPEDPFDVRVTSEEPLALVTKYSEVGWQVRELVKIRGEDRFEFYPFISDS